MPLASEILFDDENESKHKKSMIKKRELKEQNHSETNHIYKLHQLYYSNMNAYKITAPFDFLNKYCNYYP